MIKKKKGCGILSKTLQSDFYCTKCGKKGIPVQRKMGQEREPGHLKKLYCLYCGKNVNMVEIKPFSTIYTYDDFLDEFECNNFNKDGTRKMSIGEFNTFRNNNKERKYHNEKYN